MILVIGTFFANFSKNFFREICLLGNVLGLSKHFLIEKSLNFDVVLDFFQGINCKIAILFPYLHVNGLRWKTSLLLLAHGFSIVCLNFDLIDLGELVAIEKKLVVKIVDLYFVANFLVCFDFDHIIVEKTKHFLRSLALLHEVVFSLALVFQEGF
jgi:hypothetical protein